MPQIFVLSGPDVGKNFVVRHGDDVGRTPECIITLKHASISRRHAHFERDGERWYVVDDGSRNGIIVAKTRSTRLELTDQMEFQLGELLLRFRLADPEGSAPGSKVSSAKPSEAKPAADEVRREVISSSSSFDATRAAVPDELEIDELQLEDADEIRLDEPSRSARAPSVGSAPQSEPHLAPNSAPSPEASPRPRSQGFPAVDANLLQTSVSQRVPPPPPPQFKNTMLDTGFGPAPSGAGASISRSKERSGERILQYHKVANTGGVAGADMAQLPAAVRWILILVAVIVMAGLAYLAFSGTNFLKSRIAAPESVEQPQEQ